MTGYPTRPTSPLTTVRIVSGLLRPLLVTAPPGDVDRLFIVEQDGTIGILRNGSLAGTPFLDISALTRSPAAGGDPAVPAPGEVFTYLVTGLNPLGQETSPGTRSDGTVRTLSNQPCPP